MTATPETDRLLALACNLGIDDETFARVLAEVVTQAETDPEWGRPHEVIAEMRARLLALATRTSTVQNEETHPLSVTA